MATMPTSGQISLSMIQAVFGGESPTSITEYYRGGKYVPDIPANAKIPKSGKISFSDFYGATSDNFEPGQKKWNSPGLYTFVIPSYNEEINFDVFGGGGSSGESTYDGTIIGSRYDAQGYDGVPGQGSYVVGPDGDIVLSPPKSIAASMGGAMYTPDPVVTNPWCVAGGGGAGAGWGRANMWLALRGSPPSPVPPAVGTAPVASVRNQTDKDHVNTTEGGRGGSPAPYLGNSMSMGGQGANGAHVTKVWKKTDPDAPQPGQTWKIFIGNGGNHSSHYGGMNGGNPGIGGCNWK
jgi:hypothetical protein